MPPRADDPSLRVPDEVGFDPPTVEDLDRAAGCIEFDSYFGSLSRRLPLRVSGGGLLDGGACSLMHRARSDPAEPEHSVCSIGSAAVGGTRSRPLQPRHCGCA